MNSLYNLAHVTTATTGTGTITLGAARLLTFAQAGVPDGEVVTYSISDGVNREIGKGTYTLSGTTLSRDTVYRSTGAANTGKITLSGAAEVTITPSAEDFKGTPGSVFFADAGGFLSENNAFLFWNNTTKRLGIGISPAFGLHVAMASGYTASDQGAFAIADVTVPAKKMYGGYDPAIDASFIQSIYVGVALKPLVLNPNGGGNVGVGVTVPQASFHATGSVLFGEASAWSGYSGEVGMTKMAGSGSGVAPGAGVAKFAVVAGTNANTAKLIMYAGTSTTPVTIIDNAGAGF